MHCGREMAIEGLIAIHQAGITHCRFEDYNIVAAEVQNRELGDEYFPMIVDFGRARVHVCDFERTLDIHCPRPQPLNYPDCTELFVACQEHDDLFCPSMLSLPTLAERHQLISRLHSESPRLRLHGSC